MAILANILFNGVDIQNGYGFNVTNIEGDSPLALSGNDPKLTLGGNVIAASNDTMHTALETVAELIGWTNDKAKMTTVEIKRINSSSALSGSSGLYLVRVESFRVSPIEPVQIQVACNFQIIFNIIDIQNAAGVKTTSSYALLPSNNGYAAIYFEDTDCLQGASNLISNLYLSDSYTNTLCSVMTIADQEDIIEAFTPFIGGGTSILTAYPGWCGNAALSFPPSEDRYLRYPTQYAFPVYNTKAFTLMIRFKRLYTIGETVTGEKYLFNTTGTTNPVYVKILNGAGSYIQVASGGVGCSIDGSQVSDTLWNTIVVTRTATKLSVTLKCGTADPVSNNAACTAVCGDPQTYLYVGTYGTVSTGRSNCIIGELAIYKHPIDTVPETATPAANALVNATVPLRQLGSYNLKRNLMFYLDFAAGSLTGKCNRYSGIKRSGTPQLFGWIIDSDKQTVIQPSMFRLVASQGSDLANCSGDFGFRFPTVSRYNRFVCGCGSTGGGVLLASYMPRRRR